MLSKYEINDKINNYIEELSKSTIVTSFYPNAIKKALDVPLTPILERLNKLVDDDILELKFEIRCHEGSHIIDIVYDYGKYLGKEQYCMFCDECIYIDSSNISPIYYIRDGYREYLKKKETNQLEKVEGISIQRSSHDNISIQEIAIIVMKENNFNSDNVDFRLDNIEKSMKEIEYKLSKDLDIDSEIKGQEGVVRKIYNGMEKSKSFHELMEWIFNIGIVSKGILFSSALTNLFSPLLLFYCQQYPYINQYLSIHSKTFNQD